MKWGVVGFSLSMLICGCATTATQQDAGLQRKMLATRPHCLSQRQCDAAWSAAIDWENHNCGTKIQTAADTYAETYHWFDTSLACRVTKDPDPHGGYYLDATISCRNMIRCVPDIYEAEHSFNAEVKSAASQFVGQ
jgi:hypothetical protein